MSECCMLEHRNTVTEHLDLLTQWCYKIFSVSLVYFRCISVCIWDADFPDELGVISNGLMLFSFHLVELCHFNLLCLNFHPVLEVEWINIELWVYMSRLWHLLMCESSVAVVLTLAQHCFCRVKFLLDFVFIRNWYLFCITTYLGFFFPPPI